MSHYHIHREAETAARYKMLKVSSGAFPNEGMIPAKYTCEGDNYNPPLDIDHIPEQSQCLVIIVDDPDAPGRSWCHWIVWNIPVTRHIREHAVHGTEGINDFGQAHYMGPCPPSGTHRYYFKVYALDTLLDMPAGARRHELEREISGHIIAFGELIGSYKKTNP